MTSGRYTPIHLSDNLTNLGYKTIHKPFTSTQLPLNFEVERLCAKLALIRDQGVRGSRTQNGEQLTMSLAVRSWLGLSPSQAEQVLAAIASFIPPPSPETALIEKTSSKTILSLESLGYSEICLLSARPENTVWKVIDSNRKVVVLKCGGFQRTTPELEILTYLNGLEATAKVVPAIIRTHKLEISDAPQDYIGFAMEQLIPCPTNPETFTGFLSHAAGLLRAVEVCNTNGVTHGDIWPGNVMIRPQTNEIVLVDFGLSQSNSKAIPRTLTYFTLDPCRGRLPFMSPEMLDGTYEGHPVPWREQWSSMVRWVDDDKADSWGVGATLLSWLLKDEYPLGRGRDDIKRNQEDPGRGVQWEQRALTAWPEVDKVVISKVVDLINGLLDLDLHNRQTVGDARREMDVLINHLGDNSY